MTIEDFLLARCNELESWTEDFPLPLSIYKQIRAHVKFARSVISWHRQWVTLVEGPMEMETPSHDFVTDSLVYQVTRKFDLVVREEYRKRFGVEPPAMPMLRELARFYQDHPDYNEEWRP